VLSYVTWTVSWLGWACVIGVPAVVLIRRARQRTWRSASVFGGLLVVGGLGLWTVGFPQASPEGQFRQHRNDLARLAADYRAGRIAANEDTDVGLPLRLRFMSIDGHAHRRCRDAEQLSEPAACPLYLPAWQNWRAESGTGFAYYPTEPGPQASLVTAAGDVGVPVRELGDGWWWVD
jgi:hypothetical protein